MTQKLFGIRERGRPQDKDLGSRDELESYKIQVDNTSFGTTTVACSSKIDYFMKSNVI